jgi:glyoxylase-like metal-dependent hydrolase (beta-lactamase superfamily II)
VSTAEVPRARIEKTVVSGVFSLDGQDFDVDDNGWLVGDDDEVLLIDAPHEHGPILEAIAGRRLTSYSDEPTILDSIRARLLTLPGDTAVRTGHGEDTTIAAEEGHVG